MDRRKVLSLTINGLGLAAVGVVAVPSVITILSPVRESESEEEWRPIGPIGQFVIGGIATAVISVDVNQFIKESSGKINQRAVYVWRRTEDVFIVYSRACTDLGCPLNWDPGSEWFYCPCHGGIFNKNGERQAGPPNRPMWRYTTRVRDGVLEIDLRSVPPMA